MVFKRLLSLQCSNHRALHNYFTVTILFQNGQCTTDITFMAPKTFLKYQYCFGKVFLYEDFLLTILCMLIGRMEMGTSRVSRDFDIIT